MISYGEKSGVGGSGNESEGQDKHQRFDDDGEGRNEYLKLFRNRKGIRVPADFFGFSTRSLDDTGVAKWSIVWLARVDGWVATVAKGVTGWVTREGQRQKLYAVKKKEHAGTTRRAVH